MRLWWIEAPSHGATLEDAPATVVGGLGDLQDPAGFEASWPGRTQGTLPSTWCYPGLGCELPAPLPPFCPQLEWQQTPLEAEEGLCPLPSPSALGAGGQGSPASCCPSVPDILS